MTTTRRPGIKTVLESVLSQLTEAGKTSRTIGDTVYAIKAQQAIKQILDEVKEAEALRDSQEKE